MNYLEGTPILDLIEACKKMEATFKASPYWPLLQDMEIVKNWLNSLQAVQNHLLPNLIYDEEKGYIKPPDETKT